MNPTTILELPPTHNGLTFIAIDIAELEMIIDSLCFASICPFNSDDQAESADALGERLLDVLVEVAS